MAQWLPRTRRAAPVATWRARWAKGEDGDVGVERGVRAKAESERAVKTLQAALTKTLRSFE